MNTQLFKNYIGAVHEIELSRILDVPRNASEIQGIDLIDGVKGVEVKSCLIMPEGPNAKRKYEKWTLFDYQLNWDEKYKVPLYCAVGTYQLDAAVRDIAAVDLEKLERHVMQREFWVTPWDWVLGFPIKKGKHHDYRYLRRNPKPSTGIPSMPEVNRTESIPKGLLHFVEGVDMGHFPRL